MRGFIGLAAASSVGHGMGTCTQSFPDVSSLDLTAVSTLGLIRAGLGCQVSMLIKQQSWVDPTQLH